MIPRAAVKIDPKVNLAGLDQPRVYNSYTRAAQTQNMERSSQTWVSYFRVRWKAKDVTPTKKRAIFEGSVKRFSPGKSVRNAQ